VFSFRLGDGAELRLLEERHAAQLAALTDQSRTYLREWLPWVDHSRTVEDSRAFIASGLRQLADNNGFQAGIWSDGALAGVIGLHHIDWGNRHTSVGYWLGVGFQGKGLMTAAWRAVVNDAFDDLGLNRVTIACATENRKSRAISERLGFHLEGIERQAEWLYDHVVDHALYAVLADEWHDTARR